MTGAWIRNSRWVYISKIVGPSSETKRVRGMHARPGIGWTQPSVGAARAQRDTRLMRGHSTWCKPRDAEVVGSPWHGVIRSPGGKLVQHALRNLRQCPRANAQASETYPLGSYKGVV